MPDPLPGHSRNTRVFPASRAALYRAFTDPAALVAWLPPGDMTGEFHSFDARVGGGYEMSLFYPESAGPFHGKTAEREDRVAVRFVALAPPARIVEAVRFLSPDPAFAGEMTMEITFTEVPGGTEVTIECRDLPPGIRPEDNETGCAESLEKLALYLQQTGG